MERCYTGGAGCVRGGIVSLRRFIEDHREAIQYDLITSAGVELNDIGGSLTWGAFGSFIKNLPTNSATYQELHPEVSDWGTQLRTNIILADIYDILSQINLNMIGGFSRKKSHKAKLYPRPWNKKKDRKIGKGALPKNQLHEWIEKKRKERRNGR